MAMDMIIDICMVILYKTKLIMFELLQITFLKRKLCSFSLPKINSQQKTFIDLIYYLKLLHKIERTK